MAEIRLTVQGQHYDTWKTASVTRTMEALAGQFDLRVSDRPGARPWPIVPGDACEIAIAGQRLLKGFVDSRSDHVSNADHEIGLQGRDAAADLVDCSAVLDKWEFSRIGVLELCQRVAKPFGITVTLQSGQTDKAVSLSGKTSTGKVKAGGAPDAGGVGTSTASKLTQPMAKHTINPGDSVFEVMDRACRLAGLLAISDGQGNVVLTQAGSARCDTALVLGGNLLDFTLERDDSRRYHRYIVSGQQAGVENEDQAAPLAAVAGTAQDMNVRAARVLLVRPEGSVTSAFATRRAEWEASVRAARSSTLTAIVQGWQQESGVVWPINHLVRVQVPTTGIDEERLIVEANYSVSEDDGMTTKLKLLPPAAYLPESVITAARKSTGGIDLYAGRTQ